MLISQHAQINILSSCLFKMSEHILSKNKPANLFRFGGAIVPTGSYTSGVFFNIFIRPAAAFLSASCVIFPPQRHQTLKGWCASPEKRKYLSRTNCTVLPLRTRRCSDYTFRLRGRTCWRAAKDLTSSQQHSCTAQPQLWLRSNRSQAVFEQLHFAAMT